MNAKYANDSARWASITTRVWIAYQPYTGPRRKVAR